MQLDPQGKSALSKIDKVQENGFSLAEGSPNQQRGVVSSGSKVSPGLQLEQLGELVPSGV